MRIVTLRFLKHVLSYVDESKWEFDGTGGLKNAQKTGGEALACKKKKA